MILAFAVSAVCLISPVSGAVSEPYSPLGQYAGHWGIDFAAEVGEVVVAPASGTVTFAGSVAGMRTLTIEPFAGFKISVSYLATVDVMRGSAVRRGGRIGTAGMEDGIPGVHLSTRIDGQYVDPEGQLGCRKTDITRALRLVTPPQPYPRSRANGNSWRNIRPDTYRPSARRRNGTTSGGARSSAVHTGWQPVAKG